LDAALGLRLGRLRAERARGVEERDGIAGRRAALTREVAELSGERTRLSHEAALLRGELERGEDAARAAEAEMFEEWGASLEDAALAAEATEPGGGERERARLARRLKAFGDVNLLAISQEASIRERYDLVAEQRRDAEAAAGEVERIIRDIDREIEARFGELFGGVRRAFEELMPRMISGATGSLELSEEGVEIGLRLPRRGWRPLRVLSGGERSLLALAFLFGIFLGRRTAGAGGAFCILDEAEAALDDVNLARFLAVVDSYRSDGQFVLVTHQKRTMAAADVLYGVTQEPSGATAVVSKRLSGG
jgi:chromosome segregation protein